MKFIQKPIASTQRYIVDDKNLTVHQVLALIGAYSVVASSAVGYAKKGWKHAARHSASKSRELIRNFGKRIER